MLDIDLFVVTKQINVLVKFFVENYLSGHYDRVQGRQALFWVLTSVVLAP